MAQPAATPDFLKPAWHPLAYFDDEGMCVATAECCTLTLLADGRQTLAAGLRLVAVAEPWRGRGLFRDLVERTISWAAERGADPLLLYTGEPDLYGRFGFDTVLQHAFFGDTPCGASTSRARPVDLRTDGDLVRHLLATRTYLSHSLALADAPDLFLEKLRSDDGIDLVHSRDLDALVAFKVEGDTLILVDVVAAAMPTLEQILAVVPARSSGVKTLFVPDLLDWRGVPIEEDCGLMARGTLPTAMQRPFILPPTAEF